MCPPDNLNENNDSIERLTAQKRGLETRLKGLTDNNWKVDNSPLSILKRAWHNMRHKVGISIGASAQYADPVNYTSEVKGLFLQEKEKIKENLTQITQQIQDEQNRINKPISEHQEDKNSDILTKRLAEVLEQRKEGSNSYGSKNSVTANNRQVIVAGPQEKRGFFKSLREKFSNKDNRQNKSKQKNRG